MRNQTVLNECNIIGKNIDPNRPTIAIIGPRFCSEYGRYIARTWAEEIAISRPDVQFISDMSLGVSGIAAKAALSRGNDVFVVLNCGVDVIYPEENRELYEKAKTQGGIISKLPMGTQPSSANSNSRRKLIVDLADIILIVEARRQAGSLLYADYAMSLGKEVFVVPGRITDRLSNGTNSLLKRGATIALEASDLFKNSNKNDIENTKVREDIHDAIHAIFRKYQDKYNITDGGLSVPIDIEIDENITALANSVSKGILYQLELGKEEENVC